MNIEQILEAKINHIEWIVDTANTAIRNGRTHNWLAIKYQKEISLIESEYGIPSSLIDIVIIKTGRNIPEYLKQDVKQINLP